MTRCKPKIRIDDDHCNMQWRSTTSLWKKRRCLYLSVEWNAPISVWDTHIDWSVPKLGAHHICPHVILYDCNLGYNAYNEWSEPGDREYPPGWEKCPDRCGYTMKCALCETEIFTCTIHEYIAGQWQHRQTISVKRFFSRGADKDDGAWLQRGGWRSGDTGAAAFTVCPQECGVRFEDDFNCQLVSEL
ncbi:hypothetical protein MMC16_001252 [Acarospora aff. strigata]|nr:hypothetical protein [Acarospora aff. strigata]